jgi:hypothetical protein
MGYQNIDHRGTAKFENGSLIRTSLNGMPETATQVKKFGNYVMGLFPIKGENVDMIYVYSPDGTEVANLFFGLENENDTNMQGAVEVDKPHQRKGIATEMYKWAEELSGMKMEPSLPHSKDAEAFWNQPEREFGIRNSRVARRIISLFESTAVEDMRDLSSTGDVFTGLETYNFTTSDGQSYNVAFKHTEDYIWEVSFTAQDEYGTDTYRLQGDRKAFEVMSNVISLIQNFMLQNKDVVQNIIFAASTSEPSRVKSYRAMIKRFFGNNYDEYEKDLSINFTINNPHFSEEEAWGW